MEQRCFQPAYAAYKNDFGAHTKTCSKLQSYIEENDESLKDPLSTWKLREYKKELEDRDVQVSDSDVEYYTPPETESV
ncbi:MAG: hypothetical protein J07AB43_10760 [Candidatus Nanosalina sp. J07AB43]|nr:MAG: hypothetical protein J07AB43_10760 [Candidatus Nanosalina sp. J07AB43]